ncbi:MAG: DUF444 family protein [Deltaproteobacteria bacterium]|jgi:uncharacterized sporulation protein YeaH/YhbH (DUF444 family)|nr:DUF444 family protein [Deltaproteobacteria bacterium]
MDQKLIKLYRQLQKEGLTERQEEKIRLELEYEGSHGLPGGEDSGTGEEGSAMTFKKIYAYHDLLDLQGMTAMRTTPNVSIRSIDELLERDNQREKDGFPRKINVGRLIKPGKGGKDKIVIVPSTVEEKFIHDRSFQTDDEQASGGTGDGEEGEVIGEQPIHAPEGESGEGPGQGEGGQHEMESNAYDLGRILTEQFELPNVKDKGKKRSLTRYTYDLTDKHRGFGQLLDKKATLRKIVETNINLGNLPDVGNIDPSRFLISPSDLVYRILSREKDYESQAMVFFLRDYSGSMAGKSTALVVAQHVMICSWLLYQYAMQVETRFVLHDTEAKEVPDFYTYYNSKVAGGTQVSSAYRLVNEVVEKENLARDYNIYIFHGTDGDDWDTDGKESIPELKKMLTYANRVGITIAEHTTHSTGGTEVEKYVRKSSLLEDRPKLLRMDVMQEDADEARLIEGIKHLISE